MSLAGSQFKPLSAVATHSKMLNWIQQMFSTYFLLEILEFNIMTETHMAVISLRNKFPLTLFTSHMVVKKGEGLSETEIQCHV